MSVSYHMTSLNVESKKKSYKGTYLHNRKRLTDLENELMVARERDMQGLGKGHVHTALFKMDNQNTFESVIMRWMKLEPIIQSEVSQKDKDQYSILTHIYGI